MYSYVLTYGFSFIFLWYAISFGKERHSGTPFEPRCTTVFDGKGGMVAHAYAPREGRIHFDDDEKWTEKGGFWSRSQSLLFTAVHEIGHALGLNHSNRKDSVMWPEAQKGVPKLSSEDVRAIRQLFSKSVVFSLNLDGWMCFLCLMLSVWPWPRQKVKYEQVHLIRNDCFGVVNRHRQKNIL